MDKSEKSLFEYIDELHHVATNLDVKIQGLEHELFGVKRALLSESKSGGLKDKVQFAIFKLEFLSARLGMLNDKTKFERSNVNHQEVEVTPEEDEAWDELEKKHGTKN